MVTVFILEPDEDLASRWASWLQARGMEVERLEEVPGANRSEGPCVWLVGPGAGDADPASLVRALPETSNRQVLCLVAEGDIETAAEIGRYGADEVQSMDLGPSRLAACVRRLADRAEGSGVADEAADLRRRYAELESLVYLISHDLKTPLVSIQGIATILLEGDAEPERMREYIRRVQANAERIEELMRDLLEFPKVGRLVGEPEEVDMDEVVARSLDTLEQTVEESGAQIRVAEDLPPVMGDRKRLQQVFHNLIDNAIRYGGDPAQVEIGATRRDGEVNFFVRDDGEGISSEDLEKAFHLFRRLDERRRNRSGMGIGLAVTRKIVEGHGGRIWVDSELGKGSTFWFSLPRARSSGRNRGGASIHRLPPPADTPRD